MLKNHERNLLRRLNTEAESFEAEAFEDETFDEMFDEDNASKVRINRKGRTNANRTTFAHQKGNPIFEAQFDLRFDIRYYSTLKASPYTAAIVAAASLPAGAKLPLPAYIFGNADIASWYARAKQTVPAPSVWRLYGMFNGSKQDPFWIPTSGVGNNLNLIMDVGLGASVQDGDHTNVYMYEADATYWYFAAITIRCQQVAYRTLVAAINSDKFIMNNIRYTLDDETKLSQYNNKIQIIRQSLFGSVTNVDVSPMSYKKTTDYQKAIIDVPITKAVDKETVLATYINYDCIGLTWSIFVQAKKSV